MTINKRDPQKNKGRCPYLTFFGNLPVVLFLLFFLTLCPSYIYAENSEQTVTIAQWDKPKEYVADIEKVSGMLWCGQDTIVLLKGLVHEQTALFFYKTDLTDIKKEIIDSHTNGMPSCSDDGQNMYFTKRIEEEESINKVYYDRKSRKIQVAYSYSAEIRTYNTGTSSISPQRNYVIVPRQFNKSSMSEILSNARIIPLNAVVDEKLLSKRNSIQNIIEWDPLERWIYSLDTKTQILSIIDPKTLQKEKVVIKKIAKYKIIEMKAVNNPDKLFLVAVNFDLPDKNMQTNVYLLNLADKAKPVTLFLSDIRYFAVSPTGIAVYSKDYGVSGVGEETVHSRNGYTSINLIDEQRKEKNIKKLYFHPQLGGIDAIALREKPIITKDGLTLAFIILQNFIDRDKDKYQYKLNILTIK